MDSSARGGRKGREGASSEAGGQRMMRQCEGCSSIWQLVVASLLLKMVDARVEGAGCRGGVGFAAAAPAPAIVLRTVCATSSLTPTPHMRCQVRGGAAAGEQHAQRADRQDQEAGGWKHWGYVYLCIIVYRYLYFMGELIDRTKKLVGGSSAQHTRRTLRCASACERDSSSGAIDLYIR